MVESAAGEASQIPMLLGVGEAEFHGLFAPLVDLLGLFRPHPSPMGVDQGFMLAALHTAAALRTGRTALAEWASAAGPGVTTITVHDVNFAVCLDALLLSNPGQAVSLRTEVSLFLCVPGELVFRQ